MHMRNANHFMYTLHLSNNYVCVFFVALCWYNLFLISKQPAGTATAMHSKGGTSHVDLSCFSIVLHSICLTLSGRLLGNEWKWCHRWRDLPWENARTGSKGLLWQLWWHLASPEIPPDFYSKWGIIGNRVYICLQNKPKQSKTKQNSSDLNWCDVKLCL